MKNFNDPVGNRTHDLRHHELRPIIAKNHNIPTMLISADSFTISVAAHLDHSHIQLHAVCSSRRDCSVLVMCSFVTNYIPPGNN